MSDQPETSDPSITNWTRGCANLAAGAITFGVMWVALSNPVMALFIAVLVALLVNKFQQG